MGSKQRNICHFFYVATILCIATACSVDDTDSCSRYGIQIVPTATRPLDPNLSQPPNLLQGESSSNCAPHPLEEATNSGSATELVVANITNLSLDAAGQTVLDSAMGDDMTAIIWESAGMLAVGLSRGGSHFQIREIDSGTAASLVFSNANRLHVAYEKEGQVFYRAADQGQHPADSDSELVASGSNPQVILNQFNYAQVVFEADGQFQLAAQQMRNTWQVQPITGAAAGQDVRFAKIGSGSDTHYHAAYRREGGAIHLVRWTATPYGLFPTWQPVRSFSGPAAETHLGSIGLDALQTNGEQWLVASWTAVRPNPEHPVPNYAQPLFAAANPLYPNEIANPAYLHSGLNAVQWHNDVYVPKPYEAGIQQTFSVSSAGQPVTVSAWGRSNSAETALRIGLDSAGGSNPKADSVRWSTAQAATAFTSFSVTADAAGSNATVFLESTHPLEESASTTIWDTVTVQNGSLANASFEGSFSAENSSSIPDQWSAYFEDGNQPVAEPDTYLLYAAWSDDGGDSWSMPAVVAENRLANGSRSGAFGAEVQPFITAATEPPSVAFVFRYEAGDPPLNSTFQRFGRIHTIECDWEFHNCAAALGTPIQPRALSQPVLTQQLTRDPLNPQRALLTWSAVQTDLSHHDIFATQLVWR